MGLFINSDLNLLPVINPDYIEDVIRRELEALASVTEAKPVTAALYSESMGRFTVSIGVGLLNPKAFYDPRLLPRKERVAGRIVRLGTPYWANHVQGDNIFDGAFARRERVHSAIGHPLMKDGKAIGVVFLNYERERSMEDEKLLRALGNTCKKIERLLHESELTDFVPFKRIVPPLRSSTLPAHQTQALQGIVELASSVLGKPVALWMPTSAVDVLRIAAAAGVAPDYWDDAFIKLGQRNHIALAAEGGPGIRRFEHCQKNSDNAYTFGGYAEREGWHAIAVSPFKIGDTLLGVLEIAYFGDTIGNHDIAAAERAAENIYVTMRSLGAQSSLVALDRRLQFTSSSSGTDLLRTETTRSWNTRQLHIPSLYRSGVEHLLDQVREGTNAELTVLYLCSLDREQWRLAATSTSEQLSDETAQQLEGLARRFWETGVKIASATHSKQEQSRIPLIGVPVRMDNVSLGIVFCLAPNLRRDAEGVLLVFADRLAELIVTDAVKSATDAVEAAVTDLSRLDDTIERVCKEIQTEFGLDFLRFHLISREQKIIETVYDTEHGADVRSGLVPRSRHPLSSDDPALRDINPDIAATRHVEILSGWDDRLDGRIFDAQHHDQVLRIFLPVVNLQSTSVDPGSFSVSRVGNHGDWSIRQRHYIGGEPREYQTFHQVWACDALKIGDDQNVIGTISAGYKDTSHEITQADIERLLYAVHRRVSEIQSCLMPEVLDIIADRSRRIARADRAVVEFIFDHAGEPAYRRVSGTGAECLPPANLVRTKVREITTPQVITDKRKLRAWGLPADAIAAVAVFPIAAHGREGLLILCFNNPPQHGSIEWVRQFVVKCQEDLQYYLRDSDMRDRSWQWARIIAGFRSIVEHAQSERLQDDIVDILLNVFAADVVTFYRREPLGSFTEPPIVAGRLRHELSLMSTPLGNEDAPYRAIRNTALGPIFRNNAIKDPVLDVKRRNKPSFVEREGIRSAAAIPIECGNRIYGLVFINFRRSHRFDDEQRLIKAFGALLATIMSSSEVMDAKTKLRNLYEILGRHSEKLSSFTGIVQRVDSDGVTVDLRLDSGEEITRIFPLDRVLAAKAAFPGAQIRYDMYAEETWAHSNLEYIGPDRTTLLKKKPAKLTASQIRRLEHSSTGVNA